MFNLFPLFNEKIELFCFEFFAGTTFPQKIHRWELNATTKKTLGATAQDVSKFSKFFVFSENDAVGGGAYNSMRVYTRRQRTLKRFRTAEQASGSATASQEYPVSVYETAAWARRLTPQPGTHCTRPSVSKLCRRRAHRSIASPGAGPHAPHPPLLWWWWPRARACVSVSSAPPRCIIIARAGKYRPFPR